MNLTTAPPALRSGSWRRLALNALLLATPCLTPAQARPDKHFVWRVDGLAAPFYLVGSIHNLRAQDYPLPPIYERALTNSKRLIFEFDPRQRTVLSRRFREIARYPSGQDVEGQVQPVTYALLRKNAWRSGMTMDQLRHYRPWALALIFLAGQGPTGPSSAGSMDSYFSGQAQRAGKEVGGLETAEEHIAFWRGMLERDGETLLLFALERAKTVGTLIDQTREAWKQGNTEALAATNARLRRANSRIAQRLLDQRNARWVDEIEKEMHTGKPTAIVAGAGHFLGPAGVIELLRERGHRIEQL